MRTRLVLLLGLTTLALAPHASAQLTAKKATAALKSAVKLAVKEYKSDLKVDAAAIELAIEAFEADIELLDGSDVPVVALFVELQAYQVAVRDAWAEADEFVANVADAVWDQLVATGGDPAAVPGLAVGDGGALDNLRRLLRTGAEKSCDKLRKRLKQAIAKTAKSSTLNLRVRLDVPVPPPATAPTGDGVITSSTDELSIDVLVGISRDGATADANVLASGTADQDLGNVMLAIEDIGALSAPIVPVAGRWSVDIGEGPVFPEANMVVLVTQGGGGLSVAKAIGAP